VSKLWQVLSPYLYSLIGAVLLLVVSEGLLRAFWPQDTRLTVMARGTSEPITWGVPDDLLGHRLRPNTSAVEQAPEFTARYVTNDDGFRTNDDGFRAASEPREAAPAEGATRILVIGDSFAFGYASEWSEAFTSRMERYFIESGKPVEVINAGTPGYDTRTETLLLEKLIDRYRPSVVVLTFLPNDLFTNLPISRSEAFQEETLQRLDQISSGKLSGLHSVVLAKRAVMNWDRAYCQLYLLTQRKEYFTLPMSAHLQTQVSTTEELLRQAQGIAEGGGARLVVLSIPQLFQVLHVAHGYSLDAVDSGWVDREFAKHAQANGYTWLSTLDHLADLYRGGEDDLYYRFDGHLTSKGNDVIARLLVQNAGQILAPSSQRLSPSAHTRAEGPQVPDRSEAL
jgi:hypothetical protein